MIVMTDYAYLSDPDPEFVAAVPGLMTPRGSDSDELDIPGMRERYYSTLLPMILKRREPYLPPSKDSTLLVRLRLTYLR